MGYPSNKQRTLCGTFYKYKTILALIVQIYNLRDA